MARMLWLCCLLGIGIAGWAVGGEYRLGAEDKIAVTVLRHPEFTQSYTIPPDGAIDFPRIGRLTVTGITVPELIGLLKTRYEQFLRTPDVSVVVTEARKKNAYVLGAVVRPGSYPLPEGARITELLAAAGDLAGEREKLTAGLARGKMTIPVDLLAVLHGNNPAANLLLQEGDVLWVQPPSQVTVVLAGEVKMPGVIKLQKGGTLLDALAQAGDVIGEREKLSATISRGPATLPVNLQAAWAGDRPANIEMVDGDLLLVQSPTKISVVVSGQVRNPGLVKLDTGAKLIDLLAAVGDLLDRPERVKISLLRGTETRTLSWDDKQTVLHTGDVVLVEPGAVIRVYVNGNVKNPGVYELAKGGGVLEAVALAGGVLPDSALAQVAVTHLNDANETVNLGPALLEGKVTDNPKLRNGDQVMVPHSTTKISVLGMVNHPGNYPISDNHPVTVVDALSLAGGEVKRADTSKTVIIRVVNNKPQRIPVDVSAILKKGQYQNNAALKPDDIVYIPETGTPNWNEVLNNMYILGFLAKL